MRGSYVEYVFYMGVGEKYPKWFQKELDRTIYTDEYRYTFYVNPEERRPDYYEKEVIEDYTVFLRKPNGDLFVTNYDAFNTMYVTFIYDAFTNSGIAALEADCMAYVECKGGVVPAGYPSWFYEYFTEAVNLPPEEETILVYDTDEHKLTALGGSLLNTEFNGSISVTTHCVFLRNRVGEIKAMEYADFLKYYDPEPNIRRLRDYGR